MGQQKRMIMRQAWLAGLLVVASGSNPVMAQTEYRQLKVPADLQNPRAFGDLRKQKNRALRDGGNTEVLDKYYERFFFRR